MREQMIETLLQHGLIVNPEDADNPGLLNIAVEKRYLKIVEDLLKYGVNVNKLTSSRFGGRCTPLHSAVKEMQVKVAELLINYGANVNVKDSKGKTPIVYTIEKEDMIGYEEMIELLLTNGADIKDNLILLCTAVEKGNLEIVETLLKYGADVNMLTNSDFDGRCTLLHNAVIEEQVEMTKLLINYGANVNVKDSYGQPLILDAIKTDNPEIIELLLINGADIKEDPEVLCAAAAYGYPKIVEALLKDGADVNMLYGSSEGSRTPLHCAVYGKQVEMAKLLINYGANVNVKNNNGTTPIAHAIENDETEMTELLLINGADIKEDLSSLYTAIDNGSLKIVEDLLKYCVDVNMIGTTPIVNAIRNNEPEMIKLFLTNGADIKKDPKILCTAVEKGNLKILENLLKYGADVNKLTNSRFGRRCTHLHSAVERKQVKLAKLLINYGGNVNVKDSEGKTPIVYAIGNGDPVMTKLLLTNGADIKEDPNILHTAVEVGNLKMVDDLLKYGADVNMLNNPKFGDGQTPLQCAVCRKQVKMAKLLINYGANVNVKDSMGMTPIVHSILNSDTEMTELLLINGADIKEDPKILCTAAAYGCLKIIKYLLKDGADVNMLHNSIFGEGQTLLHIAVNKELVEMAKLLINYGANVNVKNRYGATPIVVAIRNGYTQMTKLLLTNGADIKEDPKVLRTAVKVGNLKIVEDLLKDGADVNMLHSSRFRESQTLLHIAVNREQVEMAKLLINYGADVNIKNSRGATPIVDAIRNKDTETTKLLLTNGADIKEDPKVLHTAVEVGNLKMVEDLLKYGADVNISDNPNFRGGLTPLRIAVEGRQVQMAKLLINYGANVNVKNANGTTPILDAIQNRDTEMTKLLLTNRADIKGDSKVLCTAVEKRNLKIVEDLLKYGANVNISDNSNLRGGLTPLRIAVDGRQEEMTKLLLNYGANVNIKDSEGVTPIVDAIRNRDIQMTKLLLTNGADIKEDPKILCTAVEKKNLKIVEDLLKHGADVNILDNSNFRGGLTPLRIAVEGRQVQMAKLLINYGANVNVKNGNGTTPILDAIRNRDTEMTKLLLTNGADIKEDPKVLHTAVEVGNLEIVEALLRYGADVNISNNSKFGGGLTPLRIAVEGRQVQMAKLLINYGANVNVKNGNGTPILDAIRNRDTEMTKLLLTNRADIKGDSKVLCTAVEIGNPKISDVKRTSGKRHLKRLK